MGRGGRQEGAGRAIHDQVGSGSGHKSEEDPQDQVQGRGRRQEGLPKTEKMKQDEKLAKDETKDKETKSVVSVYDICICLH